ncbi:MAG: efflux RND transporter periplasmic adaptor subunit [Planctomycetota bacterium]
MNARIPAVSAALLLLLLPSACGGGETQSAGDPNILEVSRRNLPITIKEDAELQAVRETVVRSEVEGQATIIYLIEEGSIVEQGAVLVRLDVSELEDKRANQRISVSKAEASMTQAQKSLEILEKELTTKRNTAQSNLRIAQMELQKFLGRRPTGTDSEAQGKNADMVTKLRELVTNPVAAAGDAAEATDRAVPASADAPAAAPPADRPLVTQIDPHRYAPLVDKVIELLTADDPSQRDEDPLQRDMGEMANQVLQQVDQIRLAMADLKYQEAYYGHSLRLAQKQFLTPNELEKDKIEYQRRLSKVGLAWNDLDLLINYELQKTLIKLRQDVANASLELERVEASNGAERLRAQTDKDSKEAEYSLAKERLDNLEKQITNAEIRAPTPGLVIYARTERGRRDSEAIREGISVRERQDLIVLPDTTRMQAVVKVQEAVVSQVREGQRAYVKAEAYADRTFTGTVTRVAQQADSNGGWMSSDRKVYTTVVVIDGDNAGNDLRSRMAAEVTIHVDELHDVVAVPLQAVRRDRSVNYVWKWTEQGPQPVAVDVGRHNSEHVVIERGVEAGERIYLAQPQGAQPPNLPQPEQPMPELTPSPVPSTPAPTDAPIDAPRGGGTDAPGTGAPGDGGGRRPGGMPQMSEEQRAQFEEMRALGQRIGEVLTAKFPGRQEEIDDRRSRNAMLDEPDVQAALAAELGADWTRYQEMRAQMRAMMGGRRGGRGGEQDGGERGGR